MKKSADTWCKINIFSNRLLSSLYLEFVYVENDPVINGMITPVTGMVAISYSLHDINQSEFELTDAYPPTSCTSHPIRWPKPCGMNTAPNRTSIIFSKLPRSRPAWIKLDKIFSSANWCNLTQSAPGFAAFSTALVKKNMQSSEKPYKKCDGVSLRLFLVLTARQLVQLHK